jgi:hypothetical protein
MQLGLKNIGPIKEADINFGDLTIFVGPQASGKSIALQWLKLVLDKELVFYKLKTYGYQIESFSIFLDLFFGEGMHSIWDAKNSFIKLENKNIDIIENFNIFNENYEKYLNKIINYEKYSSFDKYFQLMREMDLIWKETVFLFPAQRVLSFQNGWPRQYREFSLDSSYLLRDFSERIRLLLEINNWDDNINLNNEIYKNKILDNIFTKFNLVIDKSQPQKKLVLKKSQIESALSHMAWSTGQREFVPLLLGLKLLMPSAGEARREGIEWVIIEEPEMGLHPKALSTVLLLVLELLARGYKVCLSTHSTQILEFAWALQLLQENNGKPEHVLGILDANIDELKEVGEEALKKQVKVYYFEAGKKTKDITKLDPDAKNQIEANWGGLTEPSARVSEIVASVMANAL